MKKKLTVALFALLAASMACNFTNPVTTDTNILYQDDFSDPSSGWARSTDADGITDYDDGAYRIRVDTIGPDDSGMDMWAYAGVDLEGDVRIEVDVTKIGGPVENDMGVLCRYSQKDDAHNFYYFLITSDGYAAIFKMKDSTPNMISGEEWQPSNAINATVANHLRADCIGNELTLYVNDQEVLTATDSEFTGGDIGLIAGTFEEPGVDIRFDNLMVTKP